MSRNGKPHFSRFHNIGVLGDFLNNFRREVWVLQKSKSFIFCERAAIKFWQRGFRNIYCSRCRRDFVVIHFECVTSQNVLNYLLRAQRQVSAAFRKGCLKPVSIAPVAAHPPPDRQRAIELPQSDAASSLHCRKLFAPNQNDERHLLPWPTGSRH